MQKNIFMLLLLLVSIINARENVVVTQELPLTIDASLQKQVQSLTQSMKKKFQAKSVAVVVMDSRTGKILSLADSNSNAVKDFPKSSIASFTYEPGFVMAPIVFSLALEKKLITPNDLINGHQGRYQLKGRTITDHYPFDWLSAANVVIYSSNIGIAQIAQKLSTQDYNDGLVKFGFTQHTVDGLNDENRGYLPDSKRLGYEIYKATTSYGYVVKVNLLQLLQAYNVFNNEGILIKPKLVSDNAVIKFRKVLDITTAETMKKILIKTVEKGTGKNTKTQGLEIGGKTGTAYVVKNGKYIKEYNCSFVGFVNEDKKSYTIAVLVQEPQTSQYASQTAVVVFRNIIDVLEKNNHTIPIYLKSSIWFVIVIIMILLMIYVLFKLKSSQISNHTTNDNTCSITNEVVKLKKYINKIDKDYYNFKNVEEQINLIGVSLGQFQENLFKYLFKKHNMQYNKIRIVEAIKILANYYDKNIINDFFHINQVRNNIVHSSDRGGGLKKDNQDYIIADIKAAVAKAEYLNSELNKKSD